MTGFLIATIAVLALASFVMRFASADKARRLIFDAAVLITSVIWGIYVISKINFTPMMLLALFIVGVAAAAIVVFIRDLLK